MNQLDPVRFGERIRALRGKRTQEQIAEALGMHTQAYYRLEKGETKNPPLEDVVNLGLVLGATPNEMAALADLWRVPEEPETEMREQLEYIRNGLYELPTERRQHVLDLLATIVRLELIYVRTENKDEALGSVLPAWARRLQKSST